jgi:phosphoadenosine phosphosulfate reductase
MIQLPEINGSDIYSTIQLLWNQFPGKIIFTTSFSLEDQIITDVICRTGLPIKIITLDTGRHFEETYNVFFRTRERYKRTIETLHPDPAELSDLLVKKGPFSFYNSVEDRKECCTIRKVNPLKKALEKQSVWITGLRKEQSESRTSLQLIEVDTNHDLIKYNPLLDWSFEEVKGYIHEKNVPYNILHDRGYPSIGCAPCTRAVNAGEDIRSGRWWWEGNSKKECGLHTSKST